MAKFTEWAFLTINLCSWWFPEMGVPPVIIHFRLGLSTGFPFLFFFYHPFSGTPDRLGNPQNLIKFKGPQRRPARALKSTVGTHPATASSCTTTREMTQNSGWVNNKKQIPQAILVYKKSHVRFSHNMLAKNPH